jgi:cytochrome P450/NADPH-cytochrome P450 reductase
LIVSPFANMTTEKEIKPIPQPPTKFLVGNLGDLDPENAIRSMTGLIQQYGEIVKLSLIGREVVILGSQELVNEVCDQTRFKKVVKGALGEVRSVAGDGEVFRPSFKITLLIVPGLFTAHGDEANWELAHRILMPAFGPLSIRNMLPGMIDIASQLVAKVRVFFLPI